ncbi:E3 ubiquitin-protein ligase ATL59 [Morella rubra]|uniref:E3 ubiquitin-protein ligase ATL59 n=1 Tax=Morella rubra TaxID=262757 RepID=A0A6A1UWY7_9ROSI|nr:E3 ubiquitin-protein ligase ATL59 [Morella rubra]
MREALPVILYQESLSATDAKCSVCLGNYEADDRMQQIPACGHIFPLDCIARWLITHTTCPLFPLDCCSMVDHSLHLPTSCRLSRLLSSAKASVEPNDVQVEISDGSFVAEKSNPTSLEESSKAREKANN